MRLIEFDWNPTDRQLRQFGVIALVVLPALGWLWGASGTVLATLASTGPVSDVGGVGHAQADTAPFPGADDRCYTDRLGHRRACHDGNILRHVCSTGPRVSGDAT